MTTGYQTVMALKA